MPLSSSYVLRETGGNLRRNLFMTLAAILTMAVSLAAIGAVLIMRQAISQASVQSEGGVELAIFFNQNASQTEIGAVGQELKTTAGVKTYHYVDKTQAYAEFRKIFAGNSELLDILQPKDMPTSYRVVPSKAQDTAELGRQFQSQPGVLRVSFPAQQISQMMSQYHSLGWFGTILAIVVLIGAVALIVNTIQLAIFARRREVSVMKLVGATNWFIRVPFMLEGLVHGLAGAAIAFGLVYGVRNTIAGFLHYSSFLSLKLSISPHDAIVNGILILVLGALVGVLGSAFAVRRYLAV